MGDSVFSRFFDVFTARPGSKVADQYGRFSIPGEQSLDLPEGRVRIYFDTTAGSPGEDALGTPDDLSVKIVDEQSGEELPIRYKLSVGASSAETGSGTRTYVGRIEVPHEGTYRVSASQPSGGYPEPHLSLG